MRSGTVPYFLLFFKDYLIDSNCGYLAVHKKEYTSTIKARLVLGACREGDIHTSLEKNAFRTSSMRLPKPCSSHILSYSKWPTSWSMVVETGIRQDAIAESNAGDAGPCSRLAPSQAMLQLRVWPQTFVWNAQFPYPSQLRPPLASISAEQSPDLLN